MALDPPTTRPRGTRTVRSPVMTAGRSQLAGCPGAAASSVAASRSSRGKSSGRGWSAPASSSTTRRPASASRAARAHPEDPAPTITRSCSGSVTTEPQHPRQVQPPDLAGGGPRQLAHRVQLLGPLGGSEPFAGPGPQLLPWRRPDVGSDHPLPPVLVGDTEDGALDDPGMRVEDRLDLGRVDVDAAGDDQVLAAAVEPHETVVVHPAQVPHRDPVVLPGRGRLVRRPPVFEAGPPPHGAPQLAALLGAHP